MFDESEHGKQKYDPDWKAVFERDYCTVCKNRNVCPYTWKCHDMEIFIEENEEKHEDMDNDDTL